MLRREAGLQAAMRTVFAGPVDPRDTGQQRPTSAIANQEQASNVEKTRAELPELLVPAGIVAIGDSVPEGQLVEAVMLPWFDIISALERDPSYLHQLDWRRVEQLIAGAYTRDGWPEVILTPRSGDGGRDIIVSKPGFGAIRFYDQVKAYGPGQRVSANDARAIFGVVELHQNVSKAVITTTTLFAPGVHQEFKAVMPNRLELRDGRALRKWLLGFLPGRQGS
jgi:restriction system protein